MSALLSKLAMWFLQLVWPMILDSFKDWVAEQAEEHKVKRARAKATEEAKEKFDVIFNDPAKSAGEKADALKDLINS